METILGIAKDIIEASNCDKSTFQKLNSSLHALFPSDFMSHELDLTRVGKKQIAKVHESLQAILTSLGDDDDFIFLISKWYSNTGGSKEDLATFKQGVLESTIIAEKRLNGTDRDNSSSSLLLNNEYDELVASLQACQLFGVVEYSTRRLARIHVDKVNNKSEITAFVDASRGFYNFYNLIAFDAYVYNAKKIGGPPIMFLSLVPYFVGDTVIVLFMLYKTKCDNPWIAAHYWSSDKPNEVMLY